MIWGSDWPHLPDGQRDTGEYLNLLGAWHLIPPRPRRSSAKPLTGAQIRPGPAPVSRRR